MTKEARNLVLASISCLMAMLLLGLVAYSVGAVGNLDASLLSRIGEWEDGPLFPLAHAISRLCEPGPYVLLVLVLLGLGFLAGRRRQVAIGAVLLVGANLSALVLKHLLEHPRFHAELAFQPWPNSFPSGHTTAAASLAAALVVVVVPRLRPLAVIVGAAVAMAIGISMVIIYAHYPSDVLGGYLLVASWCFAVAAAVRFRGPSPSRRPGREVSPFMTSAK
jgi:membrane-associated phospholipid phosphatase